MQTEDITKKTKIELISKEGKITKRKNKWYENPKTRHCPECGKKFKKRKDMKKHGRTYHGWEEKKK